MAKNSKPVSGSGKASESLFQVIVLFLYGKKAGESATQKILRLGIVLLVIGALVVIKRVIIG